MAGEQNNIVRINSLATGYGAKQVLNNVSIEVAEGDVVALIGHNGSGKSTLLKAAFGLLPVWSGEIQLFGQPSTHSSPAYLIGCGVAYCPQGHRVFTGLSVRENLEMSGFTLRTAAAIKAAISRVLMLFPSLEALLQRHASGLSGGERQILSLACALICAPRLLLLDEPSLGLSPALTAQVFSHLVRINQEADVSILIAEQKVRDVLQISQFVYVLRNGSIAFAGDPEEVSGDETLRKVYL